MATQWTAGLTSGSVLSAATLNTIGAGWVNYTPTLTQGVTVTKTISSARYCQINKLVVGTINLAITSSGTSGSLIQVGLPLTAVSGASTAIGSFVLVGGPSHYGQIVGSALNYSSTTVSGFLEGGTSNWAGISPSYQLLNGDGIQISFSYEVA